MMVSVSLFTHLVLGKKLVPNFLGDVPTGVCAYIRAVRSRRRLVDLLTAIGLVFSFLVRPLMCEFKTMLLNVSSFRLVSSKIFSFSTKIPSFPLPKLGCLSFLSTACGLRASCRTPFNFLRPFLRLSKNESSLYPELEGFT
jgi:hypothetical protein